MNKVIPLLSREEAQKIESVSYFTGIPCRNGHIAKRYTKSKICYICKVENNLRDYYAHPERAKQQTRQNYERHKEAIMESNRQWAKDNIERTREIKRKNKRKHKKKYNKSEALRMRLKRQNDPLFRLDRNISKAIWAFLKGKKSRNSWQLLAGIDLINLKEHLESKFTDKMTWINYGSYWELDHIKPLSLFDRTIDNVKTAWTLENLQPLECSKNRSKGNRYIG